MNDTTPVLLTQDVPSLVRRGTSGRPDIDAFEAVMMREDRAKGLFIAFGFTTDAISEIQRFFTQTGKSIIALTVREILDEQIAHRLV